MFIFSKLKLRLIVIFILFLYNTNVYSQKKSNQHSLLYKVEKKGIEPFYLYGTLHIICADQFKISNSLESVISNMETLYLELNMNEINPFTIFSKAISKESIDDHLEPATLDSLKSFIANQKSLKLPWMMIKNLQPVFVQQLFMQDMLDCKTESFDLYLNKQFSDAGKKVKGLETFDFQLEMMTNISYNDQINDLLNFMRHPDKSKAEFSKMVDIYLNGNAAEIYKLIDGDATFSSVQDKFLFERNENWVKIMNANVGKNKYLYAFGAGHLGGERGVLQLLKNEGYKITTVL